MDGDILIYEKDQIFCCGCNGTDYGNRHGSLRQHRQRRQLYHVRRQHHRADEQELRRGAKRGRHFGNDQPVRRQHHRKQKGRQL